MIENSSRCGFLSESRLWCECGKEQLVNGLMRAVETFLWSSNRRKPNPLLFGIAFWQCKEDGNINYGWHRRLFLSLNKGLFCFFMV